MEKEGATCDKLSGRFDEMSEGRKKFFSKPKQPENLKISGIPKKEKYITDMQLHDHCRCY